LAEIANKAGNNFNIKAVLTQGTGLAHAEAAKANAVRLLRFAGITAKNLPPSWYWRPRDLGWIPSI
jgi:hypothetical protein